MYLTLLSAHSTWRWVVVVVIIVVTLRMILGFVGGQNWKAMDGLMLRLANFTLAIQVVLGIIMYVMFLTQGRADVAAFTGSHVVPGILALGGVGFASARARKASSSRGKFMMGMIGMIITIILVYGALSRAGGFFGELS